ncbi:hypothetical protein OHD26_10760 [Escherichia coli]|nr:hypothetical protein [Escherichia coli]
MALAAKIIEYLRVRLAASRKRIIAIPLLFSWRKHAEGRLNVLAFGISAPLPGSRSGRNAASEGSGLDDAHMAASEKSDVIEGMIFRRMA